MRHFSATAHSKSLLKSLAVFQCRLMARCDGNVFDFSSSKETVYFSLSLFIFSLINLIFIRRAIPALSLVVALSPSQRNRLSLSLLHLSILISICMGVALTYSHCYSRHFFSHGGRGSCFIYSEEIRPKGLRCRYILKVIRGRTEKWCEERRSAGFIGGLTILPKSWLRLVTFKKVRIHIFFSSCSWLFFLFNIYYLGKKSAVESYLIDSLSVFVDLSIYSFVSI